MPSALFKVANQKMLLSAIMMVSSILAMKDSYTLYNSADGDAQIKSLYFVADALDENKFKLAGDMHCKYRKGNYSGHLYFEKLDSPTDCGSLTNAVSTHVETKKGYIYSSDGLEIDMSDFSGYTYFRVVFGLDEPYLKRSFIFFPILKYDSYKLKPFSIYEKQPAHISSSYGNEWDNSGSTGGSDALSRYTANQLIWASIVFTIIVICCVVGCWHCCKKSKSKRRRIITEDQVYGY